MRLLEMTQIIKELKEKLGSYFKNNSEIVAVFLFGSQVNGFTHNKSDIDIALLLESSSEVSLEKELELSVDITNRFGGKEIDLVILNKAPIILSYRIISQGELIYVKDEYKYAQFKERTLLNYFDFKYVHDTYNREFEKEMRCG